MHERGGSGGRRDVLVVIDVQLRGGVGLLRSCEGDVDECFAEDVVENRGSHRSICKLILAH